MYKRLDAKEKKEILQIVTRLKICPTREGFIVFLLIVFILEDSEKQEVIELIGLVLFEKNSGFLEECDFYVTAFSLFLSKINQKEQKNADLLINNYKYISAFFEEKKHTQLSLGHLHDFIKKQNILIPDAEKEIVLNKMLGTNLEVEQQKKLKKMLGTHLNGILNLSGDKQNLSKRK